MMSPLELLQSVIFEGHLNESLQEEVGLTCPRAESRARFEDLSVRWTIEAKSEWVIQGERAGKEGGT